MIYSAKVTKAGEIKGQWVVSPQYTRVDGKPAPDQTALSGNGIKPVAGDMVLCADSQNSFDHSTFRIFDDNTGAFPIIIAVFSQLLTMDIDATITGKVTLGAGSQKMVLGDDLQTWAQAKDAEIAALYTWAKTGVAPGPSGGIVPFPGLPAETNWNVNTLSKNHTVD